MRKHSRLQKGVHAYKKTPRRPGVRAREEFLEKSEKPEGKYRAPLWVLL